MREFFITNWDKIIWILTFCIGIYQFFKTQKQSLEIEKLKNQLELQKTKQLLNDEKFRKGYEDFISLMFSSINQNKQLDKTERGIVEFMKTSILFAGPETLKNFSLYRKEAGIHSKDIVLYMENLILTMRKDLGVSNRGLKPYDIIQTLVVGDAQKEIEKISN